MLRYFLRCHTELEQILTIHTNENLRYAKREAAQSDQQEKTLINIRLSALFKLKTLPFLKECKSMHHNETHFNIYKAKKHLQ